MSTKSRAGILGLLVGASLIPFSAQAGPASRTVVYRGHLEVNGVPVNEKTDMSFTFFDAEAGGAPLATLDKPQVPVANGEFSVQLELPVAVLAADPAFVQVAAAGVTFLTRQRLLPAPFAARGRGDGTFVSDGNAEVRGNQTVKGSAVIEGDLVAKGEVAVSGNLAVQGTDVQLGIGGARSVGLRPAQRALVHGDGDVLIINYGGDFEGGTIISSAVTVNGALTVQGNANVSGVLTANKLTFSGDLRQERILGASNDGPWGSWSSMVYCPKNTYICGFQQKVEGKQEGGDDTAMNAVRFACCYFGAP